MDPFLNFELTPQICSASMRPLALSVTYLTTLAASLFAVATASYSDCTVATAPPRDIGVLVVDKQSTLTITASVAAVPADSFCPGVSYQLQVWFPEERSYTLTVSQGAIVEAPAGKTCLVGSTNSSVQLHFSLPCGATGSVSFQLNSVPGGTSSTATYHQLLVPSLPVADAAACRATAKCSAAAVTNTTQRVLKFLTFPMPIWTHAGSPLNILNNAATRRNTGNTAGSLQFKLPNFTIPGLALLLMAPKVNITSSTKGAVLSKVTMDLSVPPLAVVNNVHVNMTATDAQSIKLLPKMAESIVALFQRHLRAKAALMGIDLVEQSASGTSSAAAGVNTGRRLLSTDGQADADAAKTNVLTLLSRTGLLLYDGFSVLRAALNSISQAAVLLSGMIAGSMTGTVNVDAAHFLAFCTDISNLGSELAHMVGRILSVNADALSPLGLAKDPVTGQVII